MKEISHRIVYHFLLIPISLLPLPILYLLSYFVYWTFRSLLPYRKTVILTNLRNSFPEKKNTELQQLLRQYYRHLSLLLVESLKNLTIRKLQLKKRIRVINRDVMDQLYISGKSAVVVGAHYGNWEWLISALSFLSAHQAIGIGMPMTNAYYDKKINARRARFGMTIVHSKNYKEVISKIEQPKAILTLSDQSPGNSEKAYWTKFLNQDTACLFGAEKMAHDFNMAVVYVHMRRKKLGYYELTFELITDTPAACEYGFITERHVRTLEDDILKDPALWTWSHKRWKREVPEDLHALRNQQIQTFNQKYGRSTNPLTNSL